MAKYNKFEVQKVKDADIRKFVPGADPHKKSQQIVCPFCGEKKFSVVHQKGKNFAYCHKCQGTYASPIDAVKQQFGYSDDQFLDAMEHAARIGGIELMTDETSRAKAVDNAKKTNNLSFCRKQLDASGITEGDTVATVMDHGQPTFLSPFRKGRLDESFRPDFSGDDMLIFYYDLQGMPMQFKVKGSAVPRQYVRIRYANPDIHLDKSGKPVKYRTPAEAKSRCYIPEKVRRLYQSKTHIDTLFLQEGEKKAEKACKHGIISIGIQGINNFGSKDEGLLQDIQDIAQVCKINNIVLVMDSDWQNLSRNLTVGERVDSRPLAFASAVSKYKQYMQTFHNIGLSVDIWWAHVNENEAGDKGVDDLLCNSLKDKEAELLADFEKAMHSHDGKSRWVNCHKITTLSDAKIRDFWSLNDHAGFFALHKEQLEILPAFRLGSVRYKVEDGKLMPQSKYSSDADVYSIGEDSKGNPVVSFNDRVAMKFLSDAGYYRIKNDDDPESGYRFIHNDNGIVEYVAPYMVRAFIYDYVLNSTQREMVHNFFTRKLVSLLSDKQLELLELYTEPIGERKKDIQTTPYNNGAVNITADDIRPGLPLINVWRTSIVPREFVRVPIFKSIEKVGDEFFIEYTKQAAECEYLRYLVNASNNAFSYGKDREVSAEENLDWKRHIVNKITTIGYLLADYKYASERKAVVIQDHAMSEVGQSNGGAGKSMVGLAIRKIKKQLVIDGMAVKPDDDFLFGSVNASTQSIFIDDIKPNFPFKRLFSAITDDMQVNAKQKQAFTIPVNLSPKILLTTNHAINTASEAATIRRIAYMEFSSWYNPRHTPFSEFNHLLFDDWDKEQWNLFDNFMAECVMFYFRSMQLGWAEPGMGAVPPPMQNIELRPLRQEMSEVFFQWAEEYFDISGSNLCSRIKKFDMANDFFEYAGGMVGHSVTKSNFKKKLKKYCKFKGYSLNINKPNEDGEIYSDWIKDDNNKGQSFFGGDDKANSAEYFTVFSEDKFQQLKPF